MRIITHDIKERYIVYKLYDVIEGKVYIGKTTIPIYMRINTHRHGKLDADKYFSSIGWDNVVFEIMDWSNDRSNLLKKEETLIQKHYMSDASKLLNKNSTHSDCFCIPKDLKKLADNFFR